MTDRQTGEKTARMVNINCSHTNTTVSLDKLDSKRLFACLLRASQRRIRKEKKVRRSLKKRLRTKKKICKTGKGLSRGRNTRRLRKRKRKIKSEKERKIKRERVRSHRLRFDV